MLDDITKLANKGEMKVRIFSVFAYERDNCDKLADILDQSGQKIAADKLREFNKSEALMEYVNDIELSVAGSISKRSDTTHTFKMDSNPRGKALIIVNIPELMNEAKRFEFILTKLHFDVQPICALKSSIEIDKVLDDLANDTHDGDAFFMMFIGHGYQDKICGYGGDSVFSKNELSINCILDKFSEQKYSLLPFSIHLRDKAKVNDYKRMFIIYSTAKGTEALYKKDLGYTYFGRAFSHTIAQFACSKKLSEIFQK
ncbi:unnamed protein product, partial [Oppiella nova]